MNDPWSWEQTMLGRLVALSTSWSGSVMWSLPRPCSVG